MKKYFKIYFQFNHQELEKTIEETSLAGKGYCGFIDANSLVYSYNNEKFKEILNRSLVNSCDGSYIAMLASKIHNEQLKEYIGPDFFKKFIYKPYPQFIIGNTVEVFNKVKAKLESNGNDTSSLFFIPLPFKGVDEFEYQIIANNINQIHPRFIWVSLGAPKQEEFMSRLLPFIDKGVMIGVGAALNYFTGEVKDIPSWARKTHSIWLYRLFTEPKKQIKRCKEILLVLPKIYKEERKFVNSNLQING
ncbi:MAG: N-acetylglucosaminyldiphosphoundecaprenol N-acetyl-beta-D-mannosaminyltransferase [Flavobacteriales bacterium]|jgi:N-acetylglucosaminyldiphosphoundecaprenol N-acetyl-beta-D-mannosaminyltransferase